MRSLVLYESMFGNTRRLAEEIASALAGFGDVNVAPVAEGASQVAEADLVVIGAPTHAHSIPRPRSRAEAAEWADDPSRGLHLEAEVLRPGIREWLGALQVAPRSWAAFATRADLPAILSGNGAATIERRMRHLGVAPVRDGECFLVSKESHLLDGELARAREWGAELGQAVLEKAAATSMPRNMNGKGHDV